MFFFLNGCLDIALKVLYIALKFRFYTRVVIPGQKTLANQWIGFAEDFWLLLTES